MELSDLDGVVRILRFGSNKRQSIIKCISVSSDMFLDNQNVLKLFVLLAINVTL